jgi:hypothetical protein
MVSATQDGGLVPVLDNDRIVAVPLLFWPTA